MLNFSGSPTLSRCKITANKADLAGGGVYVDGGAPTLSDCDITSNLSAHDGGGIAFGAGLLVLDQCVFSANESGENGGGIAVVANSATLTMSKCTLGANNADSVGGGLYIQIVAQPGSPPFGGTESLVASCIFDGNTATKGGGIYVGGDIPPTIVNSLFVNNSASIQGGGLFVFADGPPVTNCTFSANEAPQGGGIFTATGPTFVRGTVLWQNISPGQPILDAQITGGANVEHSDIQDAAEGGSIPFGPTNTDKNPMFGSPPQGNYRIKPGSPCIDAADNNELIPLGVTVDLDSESRFVDDVDILDCQYVPGTCGTAPIADMGAYEFQLCPAEDASCLGDLAPPSGGNGTVNAADLAILLGAWGVNPGHPADLNCDGVINAADLALLLGNWGPC